MHIRLAMECGDTISFVLTENNTEIKIPRQSFHFYAHNGDFIRLGYKHVYLNNNNTDKILLTIVRGECGVFGGYHIVSKRALTTEELMNICDDIVYETNTSKLIKDKDYYLMIQL